MSEIPRVEIEKFLWRAARAQSKFSKRIRKFFPLFDGCKSGGFSAVKKPATKYFTHLFTHLFGNPNAAKSGGIQGKRPQLTTPFWWQAVSNVPAARALK